MTLCPTCGTENREGARFCDECGARLTASTAERRKLATLVFCDATGSTAMGEQADPEAVRRMMTAHFQEMRGALELHGGTVEKFVGDAVMAVFGVPETHEDDALRACRAALEMLSRAARVGVAVRIGVNTGEVVSGDASTRETFVTGDAVNVAARLEQTAATGEVLIGETTYRLVRDDVTAKAVEPLALKGKAERLPAYRLLEVVAPAERRGNLLVGRDEELALLERELEAALAGKRGRLVTVVGEPGVGKSRLVAELVGRIGTRAQVVRGACLSYGEGITYWAIAQVVRELAGIDDGDSAGEARARIERRAPEVARQLVQLLGLGGGAASPDETAWAIRRFLRSEAAERPLVVLVDDIQWADQTLLDLLSGLAAVDAPILVVCLARPELLELRPDWPVTLRIEPLGPESMDELLVGLGVPAADRERLARASAGNPLFAEELVAWAAEGGLESAGLPASLNALLGSRIDRLAPQARDTLERGAVEGELFHRGAVVELSEQEARAEVPAQLETLAARDFVRPAAASLAGEDAFRFKHLLLRDAAYLGTAKRLRAVLHERFADWLERLAGDRVAEYEEILGHHLEQAYRYRIELGPGDLSAEALAERAAGRLASAGRRARDRGDSRGVASLLGRAADLYAPGRLALLPDVAESLFELGELPRALALLDEAIASAHDTGDEATEAAAAVLRAYIAEQTLSQDGSQERILALAEDAVPLLEARGDDARLALVLEIAGTALGWFGRWRESGALSEQALEHARRAGDSHRARLALEHLIAAHGWGPTPVTEAVEFVDRLPVELQPLLFRSTIRHGHLSFMACYAGRFDEARREYAEMEALNLEFGRALQSAGLTFVLALIERYDGNTVEAERVLRDGYDRLGELGAHGFRSSHAVLLADVLLQLDREQEAAELLDTAAETAQSGDTDVQVRLHYVRARLLSRRGEHGDAERLAREAVDIASPIDQLVLRGEAALTLGDVLRAAGDRDGARAAFNDALALFERKENAVLAEQTRARLAALP